MTVDVFKSVRDFHEAFDVGISDTPEFPDKDIRKLRVNLIEEEFVEYIESEIKDDIKNISKEMADMIYIICGTALTYGIPLDKVFERVHDSNMAKMVNGKVFRREDGKVIKPSGWEPPKLDDLFE